jgi:hypothetical protein
MEELVYTHYVRNILSCCRSDLLDWLPDSIGELAWLQLLKIESCKSLTLLPATIGQLTKLQQLNISTCASCIAACHHRSADTAAGPKHQPV